MASNISGADQYAGMGYGRNSGGGGGGKRKKLLEKIRMATKRANKANKQRYKDILAGIDSSREESLGLLEGVGQQAALDIQQQTARDQALGMQSMVGRGLSGTTVMQGNANMISSLGQQNLNRLNEDLALQKMGILNSLEGERRGIMERREDTGPDPALLAQLQSLGKSGNRRKRGVTSLLDANIVRRSGASTKEGYGRV